MAEVPARSVVHSWSRLKQRKLGKPTHVRTSFDPTCFFGPLVEARQLDVIRPAMHGNFVQTAVKVVQELANKARGSFNEVSRVLFRVDGMNCLDGLVVQFVGLVNSWKPKR
jgi:hypothetical protein